MHRPGSGHQIAGAPAANQIALFSLIRFKYSTLTHRIQSPDGVVVSTSGYCAKGWGIESRWTRLPKIAQESYNATNSFFFSKILFLELGLGQRCQLRDSKLNSKIKQSPPPVQQRLDVGNRAGAADTASSF